jgi:hypothetical protein
MTMEMEKLDPEIGIKPRKGMKIVKGLPTGSRIVSMIEWKGKLMVATTEDVYEIKKEIATPLKLQENGDAKR